MLFISMLAFQLAGALILLLNVVKGNKNAVIQNCFPGSNIVDRDDENNCVIPKGKLQSSAHAIYLNIVAFADLVVGYLIAAFSPVAIYATCYTVLGVVGGTVVLLLAEYYLSLLVAKSIYAQDVVKPYSELEGYGVDTTITSKEIDDMFNDVFGE